MDKISKYLNQEIASKGCNAPTSSDDGKKAKQSTLPEQPSELINKRHIAALWNKMQRMYGAKWLPYGDADDGTWLMVLKDLTPDHLAHGVQKTIDLLCEWPPGAVEFLRLCLDIPSYGEYYDEEIRYASTHGTPWGSAETYADIERRCKRDYPEYCKQLTHEKVAAITHERKLRLVHDD